MEKYEMVLREQDTCPSFSNMGYNYDSVGGLISFENVNSIIIWNPTMRQHDTLPQPKITKPLTSLFGYDPIADEHKVLCISLCEDARKNGEGPQIFTFGAQETWRKAKSSPIHRSMKSWRCINGVLYYYGVDGNNLISYNGRLAWIYDGFLNFSILWILEDVEKHEWSSRRFIGPYHRIPQSLYSRFLLLSGDTGDDLKSKYTRKIIYEGKEYVWFPNHIESLKSLNQGY